MVLLAIGCALLPAGSVVAQVTGADSTLTGDLLRAGTDSLASDTLQTRRPTEPAGTGAPDQAEVTFQASDSLIFHFRGDRRGTLFGNAQVSHESGDLTAGRISMNLDSSLVSAAALSPGDTLSQPVLQRGEDRIRSEQISFNYQTEKGRFEVARVQIPQGAITGTRVKNTSPEVFFLEDAIYSTCTLDHPHYYIKMDRGKVVNEEEIFFTNARLYLLDIPYPLVFPFGYLPAQIDQRQSGLLEPTYAYQNRQGRGIGLQNLGWFQHINEHLTARASVDIFTSGTFFLNTQANYADRGNFSGSVQVGYSRERGLEATDPDFSVNTQKRLNIQHNQDFSPYASMTANIDLRTADYHRRNSYNIDQRAETSTSSGISYRYNDPGDLYNFNLSARHNRNFQTNVTRLSGPTARFSLKRLSPFASDGQQGDPGRSPFYEHISVKYDNTLSSNFNFTPLRGDSARIGWFDALADPAKYREATGNFNHYQFAFRQSGDLTFGQLIPSRFVNLTANGSYNEYWYPSSIRKEWDPDSARVVKRQVRGFSTARDFSLGGNLSTTLYGFWNQKIGNLQSFRHTLRPSLSFTYRPDFSREFWGYYRTVQTDSLGSTQRYSIYENEVFQGPRPGEQQSIGINIDNTFEARKVRRDSTGEESTETLRIIDRFNLSTSYNLAADSLKLNNLSANFSSRVIEGLNLSASAQFNFYQRDSTGRKMDRFLLAESGKAAELVNFSINASTSFRGGSGGGVQVDGTPYYPATYDPLNQSLFGSMDPRFNSRPVQPIRSPWSVSLNFRYNWTLNPGGEARKSASLNAQNIQFQLTPKWSFSTRAGYDFIRKEFTPSEFSLTRQLHCWNLSFNMNPFGDFKYYFFKLSVNSSQIQGILQKLPLLNNLERSSSPTGRSPQGY
ncbi:MAG: putative LPS assembly protein LptD [Balneolaceae bacterium]|nr:putative LPS assembly protein LptD [Balneolaceae bacterium]